MVANYSIVGILSDVSGPDDLMLAQNDRSQMVAAVDAKVVNRGDRASGQFFQTAIGVVVEYEDQAALRAHYSKILSDVFQSYRTEPLRPICKSFMLKRKLGLQEFQSVGRRIVTGIAPVIRRAQIVTTVIPPSRYPFTYVYQEEPLGVRKAAIPTKEFMGIIANGYPFLCAWNYLNQGGREPLIVDSFQYSVTPAWDRVRTTTPMFCIREILVTLG